MSFGQSFQITPMQLLTGAAALVNGGYMITPHFGKEVIDDAGNIIEVFNYEKGRQIIKEDTSERLKKILESVVSDGTGNKSYIPGYRIGGKTATSQKLPRGSGKYIASFLAFAPAENPVIMGLVIIDEPQGVYYGGTVAGPVMKEVLANALPYLNIEPIYNEKEMALDVVKTIAVPQFENMKVGEAKMLAQKQQIIIQIEGSGDTVKAQFPAADEIINKTSKIILYTE
jgi:stage V sporulation protein D (sporulation-specific penicillin-binding protein)